MRRSIEFIGIILVLLAAGVLIIYIRNLRMMEKENLRLQENLKLAQFFYDEVQEQITGIRRYRHDLNKHIRIVEEFLQEGQDYKNYEEYKDLTLSISKMQEDVRSTHEKKYCSHEVINAICEIVQRECESHEVLFIPEISCGYPDWISNFHLTGILMNLLDNALEAQFRNDQADRKVIKLQLCHKQEQREDNESESLEITVENTVSPEETISFKTRKADRQNHGLGLDIAKEYCGFYHGELSWNLDETENLIIFNTVLHKT